VWRQQVADFAATRRVVTCDLRAHGASGTPAAPCDVAALAGDLAAVVRAAAPGAVDVLGFSAGGVLAMRVAVDHPDLVRRLVLVGTSSECNAPARDRYLAMAATAERDGGAAVLAAVGVRDARAVPPDGAGFAHVARAIGAMHEAPLTPELARIRAPALVVVGERDPLGVGGSVIIHRALAARPNAVAHLAVLPGLRHAVFREDPASFNRRLRTFLTPGD
jgi:pimeloyl-ACP methyl ester carboxylesterase